MLWVLGQSRTKEEREQAARGVLGRANPNTPGKPKLPKQSPRKTHLHIGVAGPVLRSYQTFCFHDWKGNETVKPQSGREGIFLHSGAPHHGLPHPRGAEPTPTGSCAYLPSSLVLLGTHKQVRGFMVFFL